MAKLIKERNVSIYRDANGVEPFSNWFESIKDSKTKRRILQRIYRLQSGNYGDYKTLKDGVLEMRLHFGSGYRVYFAEINEEIVVLLLGGDKSSQKSDIGKAKNYWKDYTSNVI